MLWLTPLGVVAIIGGWVTAETGRQPYLVYGMLRPDRGAPLSHHPAVLASFFTFLVLYLALFGTWITYVVRTVLRGPDPRDLEMGLPAVRRPAPTLLPPRRRDGRDHLVLLGARVLPGHVCGAGWSTTSASGCLPSPNGTSRPAVS